MSPAAIIPVKRGGGEGKEMVPETPYLKSCWTGTQIKSSLPQPQINSSQLSSFLSGSCVPLVGRAGALRWRCVDFELRRSAHVGACGNEAIRGQGRGVWGARGAYFRNFPATNSGRISSSFPDSQPCSSDLHSFERDTKRTPSRPDFNQQIFDSANSALS